MRIFAHALRTMYFVFFGSSRQDTAQVTDITKCMRINISKNVAFILWQVYKVQLNSCTCMDIIRAPERQRGDDDDRSIAISSYHMYGCPCNRPKQTASRYPGHCLLSTDLVHRQIEFLQDPRTCMVIEPIFRP